MEEIRISALRVSDLVLKAALYRVCRGRIMEYRFYYDVLGDTKKCGAIVGLDSYEGRKLGKKREENQNKIIF